MAVVLATRIGMPFQFTHPRRGATEHGMHVDNLINVSIHAPREGCDRSAPCKSCYHYGFNSRTPGGVRPITGSIAEAYYGFNSRTPGGVRPLCPLRS